MSIPRLLLLSRQGGASLPPAGLARLFQVADVRVQPRDYAPTRAEAIELLTGVDLLGSTNACLPPIDADLLDRAPRLRGIVLYSTGYDHIDLELLRSRRIGLSVVSDYATTATAEHTFAMILALATRLHLGNDRCRGIASSDVSLRGMELSGRTLGVIGAGRIGFKVASMGQALGMSVIASDRDPVAALRAELAGITTCELTDLLTQSDVVAVCASQRYGASPLLGPRELKYVRPGSLMVNASGAGLVDTRAVAEALRMRHLRGYAVDDQLEDRARYADLTREGRLLQTGHSAWWSDEAMKRGAELWADRLIAAAMGDPLDTVYWPAKESVPA
jgi:lactate dehydrogenase-like 2-hydroxyacid dehydrogenase